MIYANLYVLLALALAGAYVAHKARTPALYFLVAISLIVAAGGVWTGGLYPAPSDLCLNSTHEDSLYYPCNHTIRTSTPGLCAGNPEPMACAPYTEYQCRTIDGCNWSVAGCLGTPNVSCDWLQAYDPSGYKCVETSGCMWTPGIDTETVVNSTCDNVNMTYHYDYCEADGNTAPEASGAIWSLVFALFALLLLAVGLIEYLGGTGGGSAKPTAES